MRKQALYTQNPQQVMWDLSEMEDKIRQFIESPNVGLCIKTHLLRVNSEISAGLLELKSEQIKRCEAKKLELMKNPEAPTRNALIEALESETRDFLSLTGGKG